jgi:hypothetical protein
MTSVLESIARRGFRNTCEALYSTDNPASKRSSEPRPKYAHLRKRYQGGRSGRASVYKIVDANKDRQGWKIRRYKRVGDGSPIDQGQSEELVTVKTRVVDQQRESRRPSRSKEIKPEGSLGDKNVTQTVTEAALKTDGRRQTRRTKAGRQCQAADDDRRMVACPNATSSSSSSSRRQTGSVPSRHRSTSYTTGTDNQVEGRISRSRGQAQLVATQPSEFHTASSSSGPDVLLLDPSKVGRSRALPRQAVREQRSAPVPARTSARIQKPAVGQRTVRIVEDVEMADGSVDRCSSKSRGSSSPFQQPAMSPKESQDLVFGKTPRTPYPESTTIATGRVLETDVVSSSAEHRSDDDDADEFDDVEVAAEGTSNGRGLDESLPDLNSLAVDDDGDEPHVSDHPPHMSHNYTYMQSASFTTGSQYEQYASPGLLAPPVQLPTPEVSPPQLGSRPFGSPTFPMQRTQGTHPKTPISPGKPRRLR